MQSITVPTLCSIPPAKEQNRTCAHVKHTTRTAHMRIQQNGATSIPFGVLAERCVMISTPISCLAGPRPNLHPYRFTTIMRLFCMSCESWLHEGHALRGAHRQRRGFSAGPKGCRTPKSGQVRRFMSGPQGRANSSLSGGGVRIAI